MDSRLKELMTEMRSLAPFPGVAARVLELSAQEDVVPGELIELVQTDPGITSKVLKLCNSAYYGFQREIASLHEAGNLLGVTTLVNVVLTSSTSKYFRDYGLSDRATMERRWEQCVANAIGARILAGRHRRVDPERAYTAGLLANIGLLVIDRFHSASRSAIREAVGTGADAIEAEKSVLGMHHAEIGARLTARWCLPEILVDVIRYHHDPERSERDPHLAATVHLAEIVTQEISPGGWLADELPYRLRGDACHLTGLSRTDLAEVGDLLRGEIDRARDALLAA